MDSLLKNHIPSRRPVQTPEQLSSSRRGFFLIVIIVASTLRFLRDLDNVTTNPRNREGLISLYFLFIMISFLLLLIDCHLKIATEEQDESGIPTEPQLAGILGICVYIFCSPFNQSISWMHGVVWWFWATYFVARW